MTVSTAVGSTDASPSFFFFGGKQSDVVHTQIYLFTTILPKKQEHFNRKKPPKQGS